MRNMIFKHALTLSIVALIAGCAGKENRRKMTTEFQKGTYGYDVQFFEKNGIKTIQLKDQSGASVLIIPGYQGRVMTSAAAGEKGKSFGWINYRHIEAARLSSQFNPFGGEERFWLGPEGGPFSIYFREGDEQVFPNWKVPAGLDTDTFKVESQTSSEAVFSHNITLSNASGSVMQAGIKRTVRLLDHYSAEKALGTPLDPSLSFVAYESENTLTNKGNIPWDKNTGFLSIWMLGMFNPSEKGVVVIPFGKQDTKAVTDDYFGKVPSDRLIIKDSILYFRTDGRYRSKIGISPASAKPFCCSYDPDSKTLTVLWISLPGKKVPYVNSKWGKQDDPLMGDAVNSYNDGPVEDGSIMGPFYEIESSSPAALLVPGESITHTQRTFHISGDEEKLEPVVRKLFNISIGDIKKAF